MPRFFFLFILFSVLYISACKIPDYAKEDKGKICELHQLTLHRSLVKITYGKFCRPKTRLGKYGEEHYPNARRQACGGCLRTPHVIVRMYHCSECTRLKRKHSVFTKKEQESLPRNY